MVSFRFTLVGFFPDLSFTPWQTSYSNPWIKAGNLLQECFQDQKIFQDSCINSVLELENLAHSSIVDLIHSLGLKLRTLDSKEHSFPPTSRGSSIYRVKTHCGWILFMRIYSPPCFASVQHMSEMPVVPCRHSHLQSTLRVIRTHVNFSLVKHTWMFILLPRKASSTWVQWWGGMSKVVGAYDHTQTQVNYWWGHTFHVQYFTHE